MVALPLFEISLTSGNILLDILGGNDPKERNVLLDCSIIERESTGNSSC